MDGQLIIERQKLSADNFFSRPPPAFGYFLLRVLLCAGFPTKRIRWSGNKKSNLLWPLPVWPNKPMATNNSSNNNINNNQPTNLVHTTTHDTDGNTNTNSMRDDALGNGRRRCSTKVRCHRLVVGGFGLFFCFFCFSSKIVFVSSFGSL